jgi:osmotically-inducible protein OsmY
MMNTRAILIRACAAALLLATATACVPLVIAGAAAGAAGALAADRRSTGIQVEDESIERRIDRAIAARKYPVDTVSVYVTSYNRKVLLVGQVKQPEVRDEIEQIARKTESVNDVVNEIQVRDLSPATVRNNDIALSAKVKARFVDAKDVPLGVIKVTTERGIVYLLGRVTEEEGAAAARVASQTSGVNKVVKVFDYLTPEELAALNPVTPRPQSQRK